MQHSNVLCIIPLFLGVHHQQAEDPLTVALEPVLLPH
jgi:hypothetical protein